MSRSPRAGSSLGRAILTRLKNGPAPDAVRAFAGQAADDADAKELAGFAKADGAGRR